MGRCIVKIRDRFFEWSTVVDAPVTYAMTGDELEEHIRYQYGECGVRELPERLKRVEETGTSFWHTTLDSLLSCNRAGNNEAQLTPDEIYEQYLTPPTEGTADAPAEP